MASMRFYGWGSWTVLIAVIISLLATTDLSTAKSLGSHEGYWSTLDSVNKRNTWWSKKSLDSAPNYESLLPGTLYTDTYLDERPDESTILEISSLYDCYIQTCMPEFVSCAKTSKDQMSYHRCKISHRLCAAACYLDASDRKEVDGQDVLSDFTD